MTYVENVARSGSHETPLIPPTTNGPSPEDLEQNLQRRVESAAAPARVVEIEDNHLVFDKAGTLYRQEFKQDSDGEVELVGDPVPVVNTYVYRTTDGVIVNTEVLETPLVMPLIPLPAPPAPKRDPQRHANFAGMGEGVRQTRGEEPLVAPTMTFEKRSA